MSSEKGNILEAIQKYVSKSDWKSAIPEMEKLFALDPDPIVRVRIGDAYQKLNQKTVAANEYVRAADLYAEKGAVVKALAQYKLALRIDPNNRRAQQKIEALHSHTTISEQKAEPVDPGKQKPANSVIPLFSSFTQDEFNDFTSRMVVHTVKAGTVILQEGGRGNSVYVIANGSVKVYTTLVSGERVELAVLGPSEFFGEISFLTGKPRTATVEAAEDTDILEVDEAKLTDLIARRPNVRDVLQQYSEMRSQGTLNKVQGAE